MRKHQKQFELNTSQNTHGRAVQCGKMLMGMEKNIHKATVTKAITTG
jgi:hypothetical protein